MTLLGKTCSLCFIVWMLGSPGLIHATNSGRVLPHILERIQLTTVGILQHTETETTAPTKTTFAIRGTGIHIGNGFILTAKHAVTIRQGSSAELPPTIHILTTQFHELSADFIGTSHFVDMAIYRI